jgi:hypothetical protein
MPLSIPFVIKDGDNRPISVLIREIRGREFYELRKYSS